MKNVYLNKELPEKTILIAEDDEISFLLLSEHLQQDNYKVVRAVNGKEAVLLMQQSKETFSLILMDILMPIMNGIEAAKKIKKINKNIPIIAQTAVNYSQTTELNLSNFDDVFLKPLDFEKLKELINTTLIKKSISKILNFQVN